MSPETLEPGTVVFVPLRVTHVRPPERGERGVSGTIPPMAEVATLGYPTAIVALDDEDLTGAWCENDWTDILDAVARLARAAGPAGLATLGLRREIVDRITERPAHA